jgi:hypothetical protein
MVNCQTREVWSRHRFEASGTHGDGVAEKRIWDCDGPASGYSYYRGEGGTDVDCEKGVNPKISDPYLPGVELLSYW